MSRTRNFGLLVTVVGLAGLLLARVATFAETNSGFVASTMAKLETMEFEFSRGESDIPFLPVAYLSHTFYGKNTFRRVDGSGEDVEFRAQCTSAYATLPLYIGHRGMALAVPVVSHTQFRMKLDGLEDPDVYSAYLPVGAAWQTPRGSQWGVFGMPAFYSPMGDSSGWATDYMAGIFGRRLSGERSVWYYGFAYDYDFGENWVIPYIGYTHVIDPSLLFSLILPWPTISYAPSDRFFVSMGVMPSGASWTLTGEGNNAQAVSSLGGWDVGVHGNWRIGKGLWLSAGTGFSGLRSLEINDGGEVRFDQNLSREPFASISLGLRPQ